MPNLPALLLIAHGSRRPEANADLEFLAEKLRHRDQFSHVQPSFLELCEPGIIAGGIICAEKGATQVIMVPYFLSAGIHVVEDLTEARDQLRSRFPSVHFLLAEPLGRHPLLQDVVKDRVRQAIATITNPDSLPECIE